MKTLLYAMLMTADAGGSAVGEGAGTIDPSAKQPDLKILVSETGTQAANLPLEGLEALRAPEKGPNINPAAPAAADTMAAPGGTTAPKYETVLGSQDGAGGFAPLDQRESDLDFEKRLVAERAEFERIRELTPVQDIELHPCVGAAHLGLIIGTPAGIRCIALADWRTDRVYLKAGDHAQIVVLAGEGLKTWEFYRGQEARANSRSSPGSGAAPADPLEQTQPAAQGS